MASSKNNKMSNVLKGDKTTNSSRRTQCNRQLSLKIWALNSYRRRNVSKAEVARSFGVPESTLRGWIKDEERLRWIYQQGKPTESEISSGSLRHSPRSQAAASTSSLPSTSSMRKYSVQHTITLQFFLL